MIRLDICFLAIRVYQIVPSTIIEEIEHLVKDKYYPDEDTAIKHYTEQGLKHNLDKRLGHTIELKKVILYNPVKVLLHSGRYKIIAMMMSSPHYDEWNLTPDEKYIQV